MKSLESQKLNPDKQVWIAAGIFFFICLGLQVWRMSSLASSMDQGILYQILWNALRGHPFESTLSSQLSSDVVIRGNLPTVGYHRLGQHFTPILIIWLPLISILGKWALPSIQVILLTCAGLCLYEIAKMRLDNKLAAMLAFSFYGANAVIGPGLGNFTDLCQLPIAFFLLILGINKGKRWLIILSAIAIPLIREDTGVVLIGIGLWVAYRYRKYWKLAIFLIIYGGSWVIISTNFLMPIFSDDNSKRFMVENFGQYIQGKDQATTIEVIKLALKQPVLIFQEIINPPGKTLSYLAGQGLPLIFIPFISIDAWLLMGLPLLGLLMAQGNPLAINWRYTYLVVPGLFTGATYWWQKNKLLFSSRRFRKLWSGLILLSLIFTITSNPNRTLSWLIPESINPWVYHSPFKQLNHSKIAFNAIKIIPYNASVSASSTFVPHLANREVLIRFPYHIRFKDRTKKTKEVEWIAVDLQQHQKYAAYFKNEWKDLQEIIYLLKDIESRYAVQYVKDGILLLELDGQYNHIAYQNYQKAIGKASMIKPPEA